MPNLILIRHGQSQWNLDNRFTGWVDVPLTPKGRDEARASGEKIKHINLDIAFTSVLERAIETLDLVLDSCDQTQIPIEKNKALNERHYGALQGLDKADTMKKFGEAQVKIWRRSYDIPPPSHKTEHNPEGISESLKDTAARTLPYFKSVILEKVLSGLNVLISAHGNSLRAIVMHLDHLSKDDVLNLNIGNGVPIVYTYEDKNIVEKRVL